MSHCIVQTFISVMAIKSRSLTISKPFSIANHALPTSSSAASTASRVPQITALAEFSDVATTIASAHATLPPGFEGFAQPAHKSFSHYLMNAAGAYVILNVVSSFGPRIVAAITHSAPPELVKAPVSSFGWIQADLRKPLPPIEELHEHPIGFRDGRRVVLCTESYLIASRKMFETIEVSKDFTEHYEESERVYVCTL